MATAMTVQAKVIIGVLAAAVIALSVALGVALASDTDDNDGVLRMRSDSDGYMGMMGAFGRMDSDGMLGMMQTVLGPDGYDAMLEHFGEHRGGVEMPYATGGDGMMHRMMDGFFQRMPADEDNLMPMGPR
jgi:hypothetical protein